jgi:type I restriction enzyme S subunit
VKMVPTARLATIAKIIMGQSPPGASYNKTGDGLPLLNGPTEFGATSPECTLFTTDSRRECEASDLIFCVRGSTTGRMNWANRKYSLGRGVCSVRGASPLETRFIRYCVEDQLHALLQLAGGGTFPNLSKEDIEQFQIPWPDNRIRIAGILSAYDDVIENNQRRIKILEEMARSLYREWFVHFRFPGHEKVIMVRSSRGQIPHGWELRTLKDVTTKIGSGATPRGGKESYKTEGVTLIRSLNVYDYRFEFSNLAFIDEAQAADLDNVAVAARDILLNITGASVARCCLVPSQLMPARVNQHVAIVRTDPWRADAYYVLDSLNNEQNKQHLLALAQGGATREALTKETIEKFPIILPSRHLLTEYGRHAGAIHDHRETLERHTQNLHRTRDLLLPRLLSGQIDLNSFEPSA